MKTLLKENQVVGFLRREAGRVPTAAAGLGLGIASLGLALEGAAPLGGAAQSVGAATAAALLAGVAAKFLLNPAMLVKEIKNPVLGSILPTFAMTLMLVSKTVGTQAPLAGEVIWLVALATHFALLIAFAFAHFRPIRLSNMVPSWFVPPVGFITAAIASPGVQYAAIAEALTVFGMINYAVLLPVMVYRLIFYPEIADAAKPTIAVLAAPASLSLVGYLSVESHPSLLLVSVLLGLAVLMTTVIYIALVTRFLRLPFSPAYASFTFPLVISATALFKATDLFAASPMTMASVAVLRHMAIAELVVAAAIVAYVTFLYVRAGSKALLGKRIAASA